MASTHGHTCCLFACTSPVGLVNANPVVYQNQVIWGPISQVGATKAGCQTCASSFPEGCWWPVFIVRVSKRKKVGEVPAGASELQRGSQLLDTCSFNVRIFSVAQIIAGTRLVFRFLSEEVAPCVAQGVHCVCPWEEGNSEASYVTILVKSSQHYVELKNTVKTVFFLHQSSGTGINSWAVRWKEGIGQGMWEKAQSLHALPGHTTLPATPHLH